MDEKVRENFLNQFLGNLQEKLDHDEVQGAKFWATVGQRLRDNSRFIGTFAEFLAKDKEPPVVEMRELMVALTMVRATCGVRRGGLFLPMYDICRKIQSDPDVVRTFTAFLAAAGISRVEIEAQLA
jgi:hypothetical protein